MPDADFDMLPFVTIQKYQMIKDALYLKRSATITWKLIMNL